MNTSIDLASNNNRNILIGTELFLVDNPEYSIGVVTDFIRDKVITSNEELSYKLNEVLTLSEKSKIVW